MLTQANITQIISQYDSEVRANTSPSYDALRAVAGCEDDDIMWEVVEVAERMGYVLEHGQSNQTDLDALQDVADAYQAKLRAELDASDMNTTPSIGEAR